MICQDCKGAKEVFAFVNTGPDASKHRSGMMPCRRCSGSGAVPDQMAEWMRLGKLMREARVARRESLFEAARRLDMGSAVLSRLEQGREPIPEHLLPECGDTAAGDGLQQDQQADDAADHVDDRLHRGGGGDDRRDAPDDQGHDGDVDEGNQQGRNHDQAPSLEPGQHPPSDVNGG